jgi:Glucosyl transferase GtrII
MKSPPLSKLPAWMKPAAVSAVVVLTLFFVPPSINLEIESSSPSNLQAFYPGRDGGYSESNSINIATIAGSNHICLPFPGSDKQIRIDPLSGKGHCTIRNLRVKLGVFMVPLATTDLVFTAIEDSKVSRDGDAIQIQSLGADPKVRLLKSRHFKWIHRGLILANSLVFVAVLSLLGYVVATQHRFFPIMSRYVSWIEYRRIYDYFKSPDILIYTCLTFLIYGYTAFQTSVNVDSEVAIYRIHHEAWVGDGRWTNFLIEKFLFPESFSPLLAIILFAAALSVAFHIMLKVLDRDIRGIWKILAFAPLALHPTWAHIIAFPSNTIPLAFGLVATSMSLLFFHEAARYGIGTMGKQMALLCISTLCLTFALGSYQSFVFLLPAVGLISIATNYLEANTDYALKRVFELFVVSAASTALYFVINTLFLKIYPVPTAYITGFVPHDIFGGAWFDRASSSISHSIRLLIGHPKIWRTNNLCLIPLVMLPVLALLRAKEVKLTLNKVLLVCLILAAAFLPLTFDLLRMAEMPLRSYVAYPAIFSALAVSWIGSAYTVRAKFIAGLILSMLSMQLAYSLSRYSTSILMTNHRDRLIAYDLYRRISDKASLNKQDNTMIAISGKIPYHSKFVKSETIGASLFEWDNGSAWRMIAYMRTLGFDQIDLAKEETILANRWIFETLKPWPDKDCITNHNGTIYIQLSD